MNQNWLERERECAIVMLDLILLDTINGQMKFDLHIKHKHT